MNVLKLQRYACERRSSSLDTANACSAGVRKYPQFDQGEIFALQDAFRKLDVDDRGYLEESDVIKATQQSERQPYDTVRQALKDVDLDSSRRVELEDYVDVRAFENPTYGLAMAYC